MASHLIIGLGGTGGKVLREFRKRIYEEFGSNKPNNGVFLEYLYLDSSKADLEESAKWKVLGKNVGLAPVQQVSTHGITTTMFDNVGMYPGVSCFLNNDDLKLFTSKCGALISEGIGGQRRRLGRVLLANNLADRNSGANFLSYLKNAVQRLNQDSGENNITFHICAGLAGGTGSGSIVDIVSQVRNEYAPTPLVGGGMSYSINLYLYVPENVVVNTSHDERGFYQANGYAALAELNAMSVGAYMPYDITGKRDPFTNTSNRLLVGRNAFEAAYLYSNVNEAGKVLDLATTLPQSVADFIFQKTVAAEMVNNGKLARLQGCENDGGGPELDRSGKATRSRKFLSFGIKRIEYPETEIAEYVTYNFARQTARQMEYNLWHDGIGYEECSIDEVGTGFATEIRDPRNRETLKLSNEYLMLQKPIVESQVTKKWRGIDDTWETRTQDFVAEVQNEYAKQDWFTEFSSLCDDYYSVRFRSLGVAKFYEVQRGEKLAYAKFIRKHIETKLFNEWVSGIKSLLEIEKYVTLLISDCQDRLPEFDKKVAEAEEVKASSSQKITNSNKKWSNIGWIKENFTNASNTTLSDLRNAKCDYYKYETRVFAYNYAKDLLQAVIEQLGILLDGVKVFHKQLADILEEAHKQAESRCKDNDNNTQMTDKKYNPESIRNVVKTYVVDKERQDANSLAIRQRLVSLLGEDADRSFTSLCSVSDIDTTSNIILDVCGENAHLAMDNTAREDPMQRLVNVNILEKLKQEYNTDEKLTAFVKNLVDEVKTYLQEDSEEKAKVLNGEGPSVQSMIQLCIPEYEGDTSGFREKFIEAFRHQAPGFNPNEDVAVNYKSNQIVVIAAKSGFPLRFVYNLRRLKEKYEELTNNSEAELNRLLLHTESFSDGLPSLYELGAAEIRRMVEKPAIIAYMLGLVKGASDPTTGETFDAIETEGELGLESIRIGKNILDTMDYLSKDYALAQQLMSIVSAKSQTLLRSNEQKESAKADLISILNTQILPLCENNQYSPLYAKYKEVAKSILDNELKKL